MAENSKIEWTDGLTFNPWLGCTKVSPACDHCYAETLCVNRLGVAWGPHAERRRTAASTWKRPLAWDRKASASGARPFVFGGSLCDVFDNQVPPVWRTEYFRLIEATPHLVWLLLTKRPGNIAQMMLDAGGIRTRNFALGCSVVTQAEADRDAFRLVHAAEDAGALFSFLSIEPMLGPINLNHVQLFDRATPNGGREAAWESLLNGKRFDPWGEADITGCPKIDWVIAGGESGANARPSHPDWFRALRDQCGEAGTPFFFKQWGEWTPGENALKRQTRSEQVATWDGEGWDFDTVTPAYSEEMHCDDEPTVWRLGKKAAGRLLDGKLHDARPGCAWCRALPIRATLDDEPLCQACCDKWAQGEGVAAQEAEEGWAS